MKKGTGTIAMGSGIVIGVVLGTAMHQLALWLPIGIALGAAGLLIDRRRVGAKEEK
jgi:hypothetical protein